MVLVSLGKEKTKTCLTYWILYFSIKFKKKNSELNFLVQSYKKKKIHVVSPKNVSEVQLTKAFHKVI